MGGGRTTSVWVDASVVIIGAGSKWVIWSKRVLMLSRCSLIRFSWASLLSILSRSSR